MKLTADIQRRAAAIRMLAMDVDGVLTDGQLLFSDNGLELKAFNTQDGQGLNLLAKQGIQLAIITGRKSTTVDHRAKELNIQHVYQACSNKLETLQHLMESSKLSLQEIAYVGDDLPDLPVLTRVGFAVAVADAAADVKEHSHWVTPRPGGKGAIRDVCELILTAQNKWKSALDPYLQ